MHQMLLAFFAMIFSFSHAQNVRHSEAFLASDTHTSAYDRFVPTREELAREQFATVTSYSETSCVSCRRMNVVSNAR
jgi:hypothetical protein